MAIGTNIACHLRYAFIIILIVLIIILLSKWTGSGSTTATFYQPKITKKVHALIKEASEWNNACDEDDGQKESSMLLKLMHATYAVAYLNAARVIATDTEIERVLNKNPLNMIQSIREKQQNIVQELVSKYPTLVSSGSWR